MTSHVNLTIAEHECVEERSHCFLDMFLESAEIVSIDAFNRPEPSKGLVVGISLILLKVPNYNKLLRKTPFFREC